MDAEENGTEEKDAGENGTEEKDAEENGTEEKDADENGTEEKDADENGTEEKDADESLEVKCIHTLFLKPNVMYFFADFICFKPMCDSLPVLIFQPKNEEIEYQMLLNKLSELKARKSRVDQLLSLLSELNISTGKFCQCFCPCVFVHLRFKCVRHLLHVLIRCTVIQMI